jgi:hypothetical protein
MTFAPPTKESSMHPIATRIVLALSLAITLPLASTAATIFWTSTAAGCVVAPGSPATTIVSGGGVTYQGGSTSTSTITLICNVVATDNTNAPAYTTLTLGYAAVAANDQVQAFVDEINLSTGAIQAMSCVAANPAPAPAGGTTTCGLGMFTFDFSHFAYQVVINITRASSTQSPQANAVTLD